MNLEPKKSETLPFGEIPVDVMLERFIHPTAKMMDPELSVMALDDDIFSFPLFTEEFCKLITTHAEQLNKWTRKRHEFYPTTDILLQDLGINIKNFWNETIEKYVMHIVKHVWRYEYGNDTIESEDFLVKYETNEQPGLGTHNDSAQFSIVVALNDEYKGGGTKFTRQNLELDRPAGYASLHPSRLTHPHGGIPITEGVRYIMVSFCEYKKYRK